MIDRTENSPTPPAFARLRGLIPASEASAVVERMQAGTASTTEWEAAGELLLGNDPPAAATLLDVACRQWPDSVALHYLLGNALRMSARASEAEVALRKAISLDPAHANASISLAHLLREQGRMQALAEVMLACWRKEPRSLETDRRTLAFLCECERFVEAGSLMGAVLDAHPNDALLLRLSGEVALILGRFDEARRLLRATLAIDANQASAWLRLAHTHRFSDADDEDLQQIKAAAARNDLDADVSASIGFALGKAFDDIGQFADAASALKRANNEWHEAHPWDRVAWKRFVDAQMRESIPAASAVGGEIIPVFVVGLPRSGTTLIESLLARDGQVRARGELNWIAALARQLGPNPSGSMLASAAEFYLRQLRQDDEPPRFIIDKNPLNFRHLGLISAMLPNAKIIHCRRHRRDNALSLWSQHFAHPDLGWTYDFAEIGCYMREYDALMAHWQQALPNPTFNLDYEALVEDADGTIARARRFLGLDATSTQLDHKQTSAIATASVWQARQPVNTRSVARWRRYEAWLPELLELPET